MPFKSVLFPSHNPHTEPKLKKKLSKYTNKETPANDARPIGVASLARPPGPIDTQPPLK
ncbi:protein of unknown function [Pseudomonas mediterranea]